MFQQYYDLINFDSRKLCPKKIIFVYELIETYTDLVINIDDYRVLNPTSELIFFQTKFDFIPFLGMMKNSFNKNQINCLLGEKIGEKDTSSFNTTIMFTTASGRIICDKDSDRYHPISFNPSAKLELENVNLIWNSHKLFIDYELMHNYIERQLENKGELNSF